MLGDVQPGFLRLVADAQADVALIAANVISESTKTVTNVSTTAAAWTPSCSNPPPSNRPRLADADRLGEPREVNRPQASVPQMPATPCADSAPTGSSRLLSIASTQTTTSTPATRPMIGAA